jgi:hypothetical protein
MNIAFRTPLFLTLVSASAAAQGTPAQAAPAQAGAAKAHICLAPTSVETSTGTAATAMSAVRETFTSFLTGPTLETAPLTSRLASQVREEAAASNCPYLLLTTLKQVRKTSGGGGGLLGRVATGAVQQGAYSASGAVSNDAARVATNAAAGGVTGAASSYGSSTQTKDELTLTTHLESADGKVLVDMTDSRKADANGEDLLTPLVEKASTAIANAVAKH